MVCLLVRYNVLYAINFCVIFTNLLRQLVLRNICLFNNLLSSDLNFAHLFKLLFQKLDLVVQERHIVIKHRSMGPKRIQSNLQLALILIKLINLFDECIHLPLPDISYIRDTDFVHSPYEIIVDQIHLLTAPPFLLQ